MKRCLFSSIFLFLLLSSIGGAVEISTSVSSGSQYAPRRNYGFQIKCDDIASISSVTFEWNGLNNYTANNVSNTFYYNLSDIASGSYSYRWIVNNISYILTFPETYVVSKNSSVPIVLTLNGAAGDKSYDRYSIANFVVTLNIPHKTVRLESTYPNWTTKTNTSVIYNSTNLTVSGLFTITASWDGDENYTSSSKTYYFDSGPPQFLSPESIPLSPVGYDFGAEYKFQVTCKDATLVDVWFESNHTGKMKKYYSTTNLSVQNSSGIFWIIIKSLSAKKFAYRWHAKDSLGDVSSTNFIGYEIVKMNPLIMSVWPSINIQAGTQITAECVSINTLEVPTSKFGFYKNSDLIENISSSTRMDTFLLSTGTYNFTCNTSGTQNYTSQSITRTIIVSAGPPDGENITGELRIINVNFPSSIEREESKETSLDIKNEMFRNIFIKTVELIGIPTDWYNVTSKPSYIYVGETEEAKINLSIPSDAEAGTYSITINVIGNTSIGTIVTATKSLDMIIASPFQNTPPSYFMGYTNSTVEWSDTMFSLKWSDDIGISGYIFSSNMSGMWENDSWTPLTGTSGWANVSKILNSSVGSVIVWKIYANDTDNKWTASDGYIVDVTEAVGFDVFLIIIILIVVVVLVVVIFFILKMKTKGGEEEIIYVYSEGDYY